MGNLYAYSAIVTKVRAMQGKLLQIEDYTEIANAGNVTQALIALQKNPGYRELFHSDTIDNLHRADIERRLLVTKYKDFSKLHKFANDKQRRFLELYFMHYEISLLKRALRSCLSHKKIPVDFNESKVFFEKHSHLNFDAILEAKSITEFVESLRGSEYYPLLSHLNKDSTIFQYETAMDHLYFRRIWAAKDKYLQSSDKHTLTAVVGTRTDILNLQWIYRSKKYYKLDSPSIYSLLLPVFYKINQAAVKKLVEAGSEEEFLSVLEETYYGRLTQKMGLHSLNMENLYLPALSKIYDLMAKKDPYSIATVISYLHRKEIEIERITSIIESVRYDLTVDEILAGQGLIQ